MKILFTLLLTSVLLFASSSVSFTKGWSLVSLPNTLTEMSAFDTPNVEIVWGFDATTQTWKAYSSDANISQKLLDNNISTLTTLSPWQAFWILSANDWSMNDKADLPSSAKNNQIFLKKGWNLISLPQRAVVSDTFFGDALVWKYTQKGGWSVNDDALGFPKINDIKDSDGLWIKSEVDLEIDMKETLSRLQTFNSQEEMTQYIEDMLEANRYGYGYYGYGDVVYALDTDMGLAVPTANDAIGEESSTAESATKSVDTTTTNLQELGVDESDILKNDGVYIYSVDNSKSEIFITSFANVSDKNYSAINTINTQDKTVSAMYLQSDRLIVVANKNYYHYVDGAVPLAKSVIVPYDDYKQSFTIDIYDVSDVKNIKLLNSSTLDGNYRESRLVDNKLFVVSSFTPSVEYDYPKKYVETVCSSINMDEIYASCSGSSGGTNEGDVTVSSPKSELYAQKKSYSCEYGNEYELYEKNQCYQYNYDDKGAWSYDYDNPTVFSKNLIPEITTSDETKALVTPSKLYAPVKLNQSVSLTSISSFDIVDALYRESISYVGNSSTYYASTTAFYLVSSEYPLYYSYEDYQEQQMIYKFGIGDTLSYKAKGSVDGRLLNQFSMSEKDEYLRVATSSGFSWGNSDTNNSIFILKESDNSLTTQATLSGLGKKGELIKAVRFMGDRGFVVTFKQTDPFYTLDLSDPLHPKKAGELFISGFSRYLHIVDENRVLSIGRDSDEKGQATSLILQLFDITDFLNPSLVDKVKVGNSSSTYSSAEYNHKALAYRTSDNIFGFPYTEYSDSSYSSVQSNFGIYQVKDMAILPLDTLSETNDGYYWGNDRRGLIFDLNNTTYGAIFNGASVLSDTIQGE